MGDKSINKCISWHGNIGRENAKNNFELETVKYKKPKRKMNIKMEITYLKRRHTQKTKNIRGNKEEKLCEYSDGGTGWLLDNTHT